MDSNVTIITKETPKNEVEKILESVNSYTSLSTNILVSTLEIRDLAVEPDLVVNYDLPILSDLYQSRMKNALQ